MDAGGTEGCVYANDIGNGAGGMGGGQIPDGTPDGGQF